MLYGEMIAGCSQIHTEHVVWAERSSSLNFMVAPCINNIKHFIVQLMHTNYKIIRLLK